MTPLLAATHLSDGANQLFETWVGALLDMGFEVEGSRGNDGALDADVVFACGLLTSMRVHQGEELEVIAAPIFAGETRAVYRSVIIASADTPPDALASGDSLRLGVNEYDSWSGWHGLKQYLRTHSIAHSVIGAHVLTGGHVDSIEAVLDGSADVASIDQSVWDARLAIDPRLNGLHTIAATSDWPSPPVSLRSTLDDHVRIRLTDAITSLPGIVPVHLSDYDFMLSEAQQYPTWP